MPARRVRKVLNSDGSVFSVFGDGIGVPPATPPLNNSGNNALGANDTLPTGVPSPSPSPLPSPQPTFKPTVTMPSKPFAMAFLAPQCFDVDTDGVSIMLII